LAECRLRGIIVSVLTSAHIKDLIFNERNTKRRLTVTPLLDPEEQIQGGSLDIRLGNHFLVYERGKLGLVDPANGANQKETYGTERREYVQLGKSFIVHPAQFVLGCSLEYFGLPYHVVGYVVGRSSWGRLGLVIATAFGVHAGYRGVITLELTNLGEVPVRIYPGWPIAQIFFHEVKQDEDAAIETDLTPYSLSVRPEPSTLSVPTCLRELINKNRPQEPSS
jgi:dCTP deaminase